MAQIENAPLTRALNGGWDRTPAHVPLDYLRRMTDDTGMIQHGIGGIPDAPTGYTTDDNCRALLACVRLWRRAPERRAEVEPLIRRYLQFLLWVQVRGGDHKGWFVNFVSYDRRFLDERGTDDCLGRCLWCLGEIAAGDLPSGTRLAVQQMLSLAIPPIRRVESPRARAYALLGLCHAAAHDKDLIRELVTPLAGLYRHHASQDWQWFEPYLTYDNARMVEAVLRAADVLDDGELRRIGCEAEQFLTAHSFEDGYLAPIGCRGWWKQGGPKARWDQQTIEAGAYAELYRLIGDETHLSLSLDWFDGRNVHGMPLYDPDTGGCYDGLTHDGVNLNMGAESVLSYLLAVTS